MKIRRFLIAPSLVRLLRLEMPSSGRALEGYFAHNPDRIHFVSIEPGQSHLVMITPGLGTPTEERVEVPRAHAEALLDVCAGKIAYDQIKIGIEGGREVVLECFMAPAALDLLTIRFEQDAEADAFMPPPWFGTEVSDVPGFQKHRFALGGPPERDEVPLSKAALDAILDLVERGRGISRRELSSPLRPSPGLRVAESFRRRPLTTEAMPSQAPKALTS